MSKRAPGEGSIYFRKERGQHIAVLARGQRLPGGGRYDGPRREFTSKRSQHDAIQKRASAIRDAERGLPVAVERQTVAQYLANWLEHDVRPKRKSRTYDSYEATVRLQIIPSIGDVPLRMLAAQHVRAVLAAATDAGLAPATVRNVRYVLHAALKQAQSFELIARNPVSLVSGPSVPKSEVEPFSMEETTRILEAAEGARLGAYAVLLLAAGLRVSEGLGLVWSDISFEQHTLEVRYQLSRRNGEYVRDPPKSASGRRTIVLPRFALEALRQHRIAQREEQLRTVGWENDLDLVFTTESGRPLHRSTPRQWFQDELLPRAGVERRGRSLKELRHSAATLLHHQGATARDIMETLGHANIRTTLDIYTHVLVERRQHLADGMDEWREAQR